MGFRLRSTDDRVIGSTLLPKISASSNSIPTRRINPGVRPGAKVTSRSTSLSAGSSAATRSRRAPAARSRWRGRIPRSGAWVWGCLGSRRLLRRGGWAAAFWLWRSLHEDIEAFLRKMTIARQYIANRSGFHDVHGNTVRHTVPLVQTIFVSDNSPQERQVALANDRDVGIVHDPSHGLHRFVSLRWASLRQSGEKFRQHLLGRNQTGAGGKDLFRTQRRLTPLIFRTGYCDPVRRIHKDFIHSLSAPYM